MEQPPPALDARLNALAAELVDAHRARVLDDERVSGLLDELQRILDAHPDHVSYAIGHLLGGLATFAARALEQWDLAAFPMIPATRFLAERLRQTSKERARHGA